MLHNPNHQILTHHTKQSRFPNCLATTVKLRFCAGSKLYHAIFALSTLFPNGFQTCFSYSASRHKNSPVCIPRTVRQYLVKLVVVVNGSYFTPQAIYRQGRLVKFDTNLANCHENAAYNSLRPCKALLNVTESTYSISPPTGSPRANRVIFTPRGFNSF